MRRCCSRSTCSACVDRFTGGGRRPPPRADRHPPGRPRLRLLGTVPALLQGAGSRSRRCEMLAHRVAWSLLFVIAHPRLAAPFAWLPAALRDRRTVADLRRQQRGHRRSTGSSTSGPSTNGRVVEASLGYFINPLVNVLVGALFLHERLRRAQWAAVALAAVGVLWLTWQAGHLPWIALVLACSFGSLRPAAQDRAARRARGPDAGDAAARAAGDRRAVAGGARQRHFAVRQSAIGTQALIAPPARSPRSRCCCSPPARAASRSRMLGLLQYIGPTLQLLLGVLAVRRGLRRPNARSASSLIWLALALYSVEGWWRSRRAAP